MDWPQYPLPEAADFILKNMDTKAFYETHLDEEIVFDGRKSQSFCCPFPDHEDSTPSFVFFEDGMWKCYGKCQASGTAIQFYQRYHQYEYTQANLDKIIRIMYDRFVHPLVPTGKVINRHLYLMRGNLEIRKELAEKRCLTVETMKEYLIGYDADEDRFTIPIPAPFNQSQWFHDCRRIDRSGTADIKNLPWDYASSASDEGRKFSNNGNLFPYEAVKEDVIFLCEGEWDTLLMRQHGWNGLHIGGAGTMPNDFIPLFRGKKVVVCYDMDEAGDSGCLTIQRKLAGIADVYRLEIPLESGKDICDFFVGGGDKRLLEVAIEKLIGKPEGEKQQVDDGESSSESVPFSATPDEVGHLSKVFSPSLYNKEVLVTGMVVGESSSATFAPSKVRVTCQRNNGRACIECPMFNDGVMELDYHPDDEIVLFSEDCTDAGLGNYIKGRANIPTKCSDALERIANNSVRTYMVAPPIGSKTHGEYKQILVYKVGEPLELNKMYKFKGYVTHHPKTQEAAMIVTEATPEFSELQRREPLSEERMAELKNKFKQYAEDGNGVAKKVRDLANILERNVTFRYNRLDLHLTYMLTYFSALEIPFEGEIINGYIESLVTGDTNTGKSSCWKAIENYFGLGTNVSGESCSKVGLIGGFGVGERKMWSIGLLPQNDGGCVMIDEGAQLTETIPMLKTVREGVADYNRGGVKMKTPARVRKAILANTRRGSLEKYPFGCMSTAELFSDPADISRFTIHCFIKDGDVEQGVINKKKPEHIKTDITNEDWRDLLVECWRLKPEDILITDSAYSHCYLFAEKLSTKYSPAIPFIQKTTARGHLIRVATALACLCCNYEGGKLVVSHPFLEAAHLMLTYLYDSEACGYNHFSEMEYANSRIVNEKEIEDLINGEENREHTLDYLTSTNILDTNSIMEAFLKVDDALTAKGVMKKLISNKCLRRTGKNWEFTPAFTKLIRRLRSVKRQASGL